MIIGLIGFLFAIVFAATAVFIADPHLFIDFAEEISYDVNQLTKPKGKHFA